MIIKKLRKQYAAIALLICSFTLFTVFFSQLFKKKRRGAVILIVAIIEAAAGAYLLYYDYVEKFAAAARARFDREKDFDIELFGDGDEAREAGIIMAAELSREDSGCADGSAGGNPIKMTIPRDEEASEDDFK